MTIINARKKILPFNRLLFKKQQQTAFGTGFPGENYPVFPIIWSMFKVAREQVAKGWNFAGAMTTYRYYRGACAD
ncbi:hypothetical protein [Sodalis sp. (in: enterobacteria)]|uniref:hypothetical protein n=1 Tax=Sodalis sp. (in: enterobacteria) TaxID=1898979 RepID=UPI003F3C44AF